MLKQQTDLVIAPSVRHTHSQRQAWVLPQQQTIPNNRQRRRISDSPSMSYSKIWF